VQAVDNCGRIQTLYGTCKQTSLYDGKCNDDHNPLCYGLRLQITGTSGVGGFCDEDEECYTKVKIYIMVKNLKGNILICFKGINVARDREGA
jgi:hypothetical protein